MNINSVPHLHDFSIFFKYNKPSLVLIGSVVIYISS